MKVRKGNGSWLLRTGARALILCLLLVLVAGLPLKAAATGMEEGPSITAPAGDEQPVAPTGDEQPVAPTGDEQPVAPTGDEQPVASTGDEQSVTPTDDEQAETPDEDKENGATSQAPAVYAGEKTRSTSGEGAASVTGAEDTEDETYSVPSGSAYIYEIGKSIVYNNDANEGNAIQQGLKGALTYIKGLYDEGADTTDRTATIVVSKGTYENGIELDSSSEGTLRGLILEILGLRETNNATEDKLTIRIAAEDAVEYDADGNITGFNADAAGDAQLEGDVNILAGSLNLNMVLAGLYYSTRGLIHTDDVDSLTVMGTQKDDYIRIEAENVGSSVTVNTGAGDDVVQADISGRAGVGADMITYIQIDAALRLISDLGDDSIAGTIANVTLPEGISGDLQQLLLDNINQVKELRNKLAEAAKAAATEAIQVNVNTGSGSDKLELNLIDSTRFASEKLDGTEVVVTAPESGEEIPVSWMTQMSLYINVSAFDVTIDGDDGEDRLTVTGQRDTSNAYPLVKAASNYVFEKLSNEPTGSIRVNGGAGDDVITVDNSVMFATRGQTTVTAQGGTGFDRLHLTGKLDPDAKSDERIKAKVKADSVEFTIRALASLTINDGYTNIDYKLLYPGAYTIIAKGMDAYTDTLENKDTVVLDENSGITDAKAFTNYVVSPSSDGTVSFDATKYLTIPENLLLANILVTAEEGQKLTIQNLNAPNLNVTIQGDDIEVTGTILGRNILLVAYGEDKAIVEISADLEVETGLGSDTLPSGVAVEGATLGLYDMRRTISITIGDKARLIAREAVDLSATLYLYHDFVPGLEILDDDLGIKFNPVTIKAGYATISVTGTIHAGGSVQITADVDVDVDVTNGVLQTVIPVAIGMIGGNAKVTVTGSADIRSGLDSDTLYNNVGASNATKIPTRDAGTLLRADSTLRVQAHAGAGVLKFNVALAAVDFDTEVTVSGKAKIVSGGDVRLLARNHLMTSVSSAGYPSNVFNVAPQTGVFMAGTLVSLNTKAQVLENASIRSVFGGVQVDGISRVSNTTVAVAIPSQTESVKEQFTALKAIPFISKLLDLEGLGSSLLGTLTEKAGLDKLTDLFTKSTESAGDGSSTKQLLGAFALAYLDAQTNAKIDTTGSIQAAKALSVLALGEIRSEVRADGSLYRTPNVAPIQTREETPNKAAGAGLALAIVQDQADARITRGTISVGGLNIRALLGESESTLVAKSGHLPEDKKAELGLAGAIGVQLASFENNAIIEKNTVITLLSGSTIEVIAQGSGRFVTVGDASGKRVRFTLDMGAVKLPMTPNYTGSEDFKAIGAGIAVDTIRVESRARIEDGVSINGTPEHITVSADFEGTHHIEAAAGAEGGTSVIPVLALSLSGVEVDAYLGKGNALIATGGVTLTASNSMERTLVSDAQAAGVKVGLGAAVGVLMASDKVEATLARSISGKNLNIEAESISRVTETVKASARGITPAKGSGTPGEDTTGSSATQKEVEDLISSNKTGEEKLGKGGVDQLIDKLISTLSGLASKLPKSNSANLSSDSVNSMGSSRSSAGTSEGNVQVAAAVAVNILSNTVRASIGDGLNVTMEKDVHVISRQDTDAAIRADGSAVKAKEGVGVAVAVNYLRYVNEALVGTGKLSAGGNIEILATIVEDAQKRAVEEILAELVKYFADQNGMDFLLEKAAEKKGISVEALKQQLLGDYQEEYAKLSDADKKKYAQEISDVLFASLNGETVKTSISLAADVLESILAEFRDLFRDPQFFLDILANDGTASDKIEDIFNEMQLDGKMTLASLRELLSVALTEKFGNPSELDGIGCRISTVAISGEGASNVGVAGSVAITDVKGTTLAQVKEREAAQTEDITAGGTITVKSEAAQKTYTTATASTVANGAPDKNVGGTSASTTVGVGASFAMTLADVTSKALVGNYRRLKAQALGVLATAQNDVDTIAVAGQDPIGVQQNVAETTPEFGSSQPMKDANNSTPDDIAADAAVALTILSNTVYAQTGKGCVLNLTGGNKLTTDLEQKGDALYNLVVRAYQRGQTLTNSSGFALANKAAVGASVALNIASSDVQAVVQGSGTLTGKTLVQALTANEDEVNALAVVTGVNLDRYQSKLRWLMDTANSLDKPSTGSINNKVVNAINGKAGEGFGAAANKNLPLSGMLIQKLNISLPDVKKSEKADSALKDNGNGAGHQSFDNSSKGQSVNIAAALGVNITNHRSLATLDGVFTTLGVEVSAENRGNFRTTGSGATVTPGTVGNNNISVGVAVSVNNNRTTATLGGNLTASGDVSVTAKSTQNMDGKYPGLLAAQALGGSIGGTGGKVGMAGAVAVVVNQAKTQAYTLDGSIIQLSNSDNAWDLKILSSDKSKLALRAGALQLGGQTVGAGASFGILYAENEVLAAVGQKNTITARDLTVQALREKITAGDYEFPFDWDTLFTVNVPDDDAARKGLININISDGKGDSKVGDNSLEVTLSSDDLLKIMDLLNYGTMTNYYVEAIAGAISGATGKLGLAGAVSMIYATAETLARIGSGSNITLTGELDVNAQNETRVRQIAGALGASGQSGVGVNMTGYVNERNRTSWNTDGTSYTKTLVDQTIASIDGCGEAKDKTIIIAPLGISVKALADLDVLAVSIAAGVVSGAGKAAVGGTFSTIAAGNEVKALVGDWTKLTADQGSILVSAENKSFLLPIAASVAGGTAKVAPGGTFSAIVVENHTEAAMGDHVEATALKDISILATSEEKLINWLNASAISTGSSVAGVIGVLVTDSNTRASLGQFANLTAKTGNIEIHAKGDVFQVVVLTCAAASAGGNVTADAVVNVSVFQQTVEALVGANSTLRAYYKDEKGNQTGGNVLILAQGRNRAYLITVGGSVSSNAVTVSGNVVTVVSKSTAQSLVGENTSIKAWDTVAVSADLDTDLIHIAPNVALSGTGVAVGATVSTLVSQNTIMAILGDGAKLIACAAAANGGYATGRGENRDEKRRGIFLNANAGTRLVMATVCVGATTGTAGVSGVVNTLVIRDSILSQTGEKVVLSAGYDCDFADFAESGDEETDEDEEWNFKPLGENAQVAIESYGDSQIYTVAGSIGGGSTAGIGASVVTLVVNKTVEASAADATVLATGNVTVDAWSEDLTVFITMSFGGGGTAAVEAGVTTLVYDSSVAAMLQGTIRAKGDLTIKANSTTDLILTALAAGGAGTAAVSGGANTLVFQNKVLAQLGGDAEAKNITVQSNSDSLMVNAAGGVSGAGTVSVQPVAVVTYYKGSSQALVASGSVIRAEGSFKLYADSKETITSDAIGAGGSGTVAVSGVVVVTVFAQTTRAKTMENVSITATSIDVHAVDTISFVTAVGAVEGSGAVSVGVIASVTVLHNTVEAGFTGGADLTQNVIKSTVDTIAILAKSHRDVRAYGLNVAASGTAAVAPTVMVLVVGGKLDQDSADILAKGFDADAYADSFDKSTGYDINGLPGMLESDGQRNSELGLDSTDFEDGYVSGDFENDQFQDYNSNLETKTDTGRGENQTFNPEKNATISGADGILATAPKYDPADAVTATIGKVNVISTKDITVTADDLLQAELLNTAIAGSGVAAVGTGVSVAVLYSNVVAGVDDGAQLQAEGAIQVEAISHSAPYEKSDSDDEKRSKLVSDQLAGSNAKITDRTIRVISIAASDAIAGVSVVGSVISFNSKTIAYMNGNVTKASSLVVKATTSYPNTLALTGAQGGGIAGVTASFAVVVSHAQVSASIGGSANICNVSNISVTTNAGFDAIAAAVAVAGGAAGVNGGVAVSVNRTQVKTFLGANMTTSNVGTILVETTHKPTSEAYILGAAAGATAANGVVVITIVSPTVYTYIGVEPGTDGTSKGTIQAGNVTVKSTVESTAAPQIILASGGGTIMNGAVMMVINKTKAITGIRRKSLNAGDITVTATMDAEAKAQFASASVGSNVLGATIAYVLLEATNEAVIDVTGVAVKAGNVTVTADGDGSASAYAFMVAAGSTSANLNIAIADNHFTNLAHILGQSSNSILNCVDASGNRKNLTVKAVGTASATAELVGLTVSTVSANGAAVVAVLRSVQKATLEKVAATANTVSVTSELNKNNEESAKATITLGTFTLAELKALVAVAYGQSESTALVQVHSLDASGDLTVSSTGKAGVVTTIRHPDKLDKADIKALTATVMAGFAYNKAKFCAHVDGGTITAKNIEVKATDILTKAVTKVTPSGLAANANLAGITANIAVANVKADISAKIMGTGTITLTGMVQVLATSTSYSQATIQTSALNLEYSSVAANIALALLKTTQEASVAAKQITLNGTLKVSSELNQGYTGHTAQATTQGKLVDVSAYNGQANVMIARSEASSIASVGGGVKANKLELYSKGKSDAFARPADASLNLSLVGLGINVVWAEASGTFKTLIQAGSNTLDIGSGGISMETNYTATADAISGQPTGGLKAKITGVSMDVNYAKAKTNVTAAASILSGTVTATGGSLSMKAIGKATATAEITGADLGASGLEIAANWVYATVSGSQTASIEGGTVTASGITLDSQFNYASNYNGKDYDALATVGSNGGNSVKYSYAKIQANKAVATLDAQSIAKIAGAKVTSGGTVQVLSSGSARAQATVSTGSSVSRLNVTTLETQAKAAGTFRAEADLSGGSVDAKTVEVKANSFTDAQAYTANAGGVVSSTNVTYNKANAQASGTTAASFGGHGNVTGDVTVSAVGTVKATAETKHPTISVSGVKLAVNQTSASADARQSATLMNTGDMTVKGNVTVESSLTSTVSSDVGGGNVGKDANGKDYSISGITTELNSTSATGSTSNTASIAGGQKQGTLNAKGITVKATTTSTVTATTKKGVNVSFASFGGLSSQAYTQDSVSALVEKSSIVADSLAVNASSEATATAESRALGSASFLDVDNSTTGSKAQAGVGKVENTTNGTKNQTVQAYIGDNASITLTGDLLVKAFNKGYAEASLIKGGGVAFLNFTHSALPTVSYYKTQAYVGDNSSITAGGKVDILTEEDTRAKSEAVSSSISFAVSVNEVYGSNKITTNNLVKLGKSSIFATNDVTIKAFSKATMYARTVANSKGGFTNDGDLLAENRLTRKTRVEIKDGASIESDFGNVEILAQSGTQDSIETYARLDGLAFTDFKHTSAKTCITSENEVEVGAAKITDTFGTVHIWADASLDKLYTNAYAYASGLGAEPSATTEDTIRLTHKVTVTGNSTTKAELTARYLEIHARNTKVHIESFSDATGKALGANVDAKSIINLYLDCAVGSDEKVTKSNDGVSISNAILRGYDTVNVTATGAPEYASRNVYARAKIYLGAIGHGLAKAAVNAYSYNDVTIGGNVTIHTANATIRGEKFSGNVVNKKETGGFIYKNTEGNVSTDFHATTTVDNGTKFYIGDAAGIVIDIYEKGGVPQVRQVGLKDEKSIWSILDDKLVFRTIANNKAGYLNMAVTSGNYTVYDQWFIPYVRVTNRTGVAIELSGITLENSNYITPRVTLGGGTYQVKQTDRTQPEVTVTNRNTGSVHVSGMIANPRGSVSFLWVGKDSKGNALCGDLTSVETVVGISGIESMAPIWAHSLVISNANNVGIYQDDTDITRFAAWLITYDTNESVSSLKQTAEVCVDAKGYVYLALTHVLLKEIKGDTEWRSVVTGTANTTAFTPAPGVQHIRADGHVDLLLNEAQRAYRKAGTSTIAMPVPGSLEYITDALVGLSKNVTLSDLTALARYLESYDLATGISVYYLPNGTKIYTDANGEIIRITEDGVDFGLGDYSYDSKTGTVTLAEGVTFSLNSGCLNVQEGYSYDALLSAISGSWLMGKWTSGTFQFLYSEGENGSIAKATTITKWLTSGNVTYYYLQAGSTTLVTGSANAENYILVYDSAANTLQAFKMTNGGSGGPSQSNYQKVTLYTRKDGGGHYDSYYDDRENAYGSFTDWNGNTFEAVYRSWWKSANGDYSSSKSDGATLVDFWLVVGKSISGIQKSLSDVYTFDEFLDVSAKSVTGFTGLKYKETGNKWTLTYTSGGTEKTVDLTGIVNLGNGYFYIPDGTSTSDSTANVVYQKLAGKVWKMEKKDGNTFSFNACTYMGYTDDGDNRRYNMQESYTLYSYYYEYTYATLEEIGLTLAPSDTSGKWDIIFNPAGKGTITVEGSTTGVQMKQVLIPKTSLTAATTGYRITDSLYIKNDGLAILLNGNFTATYNSKTGVYESTKTKLTNLTRKETDVAYAPTICIKQGQQVMLEAITGSEDGCIARDIEGRYYLRNSGTWSAMTESKTEAKQDNVIVDQNQKSTMDDVTVVTRELSYGGTKKLTIQEIQVSLSVIGQTEAGLLVVRTVNGEKEYYILRNGQWSSLTDYAAAELRENLNPSTTTITMTAATFVIWPDGTIVGSDGSVIKPGIAGDTEKADVVSGSNYQLGDITGASVTITMTDTAGSLLDANDTDTEKNLNIEATAGDVTFVTASSGSIGTKGNPLEIKAAGKVNFQDLDGNNSLKTDVYLKSESDIVFGNLIVDGLGQQGDTELIADSDGSISYGILTVINGGLVDLTAAKNIAGSGKLDISTAVNGKYHNSQVSMNAEGDITLANVSLRDASKLTLTAGGAVSMAEFVTNGNGKNAKATIDAGTDVTMGSADLKDGDVTVEADGSFTIADYLTAKNSDLTVHAGEDVTIGREITADGSKLTLTGGGNVSLDKGSLTNCDFAATAGKNITFDTLEAVDSSLTLSAGGSIQTTREDGYIYFRAADEKLTLSAGGDIGRAERYLIVDTDSTLYITTVDSYYIDSVELVGDKQYQRVRPGRAADGTGRDQAGAWKTGELLLTGAAKDTLYGQLGKELNTDIASMVISRQNREDWIGLLGTEALTSLIRSGTIDSGTLGTLLQEDLTEKELKQLLEQGDTENGCEALAALLLPKLTARKDATYLVEDEALTRYLAGSLDAGLVDIDRMANILSGILTQEELARMIENAWAKADYSSHENTRPPEDTLRKLEIAVGEATGAAFVENLGDIVIRQATGTLTAGQICSDRGNVTLIAAGGGIEGNADGLTDITGAVIDLTAKGGVGANTPLTIDQRVKKPTLVSNVTKPTGGDDVTVKPLGADSKPTAEATKAERPQVDWGLETEFTYDWIRATYEEQATRLNITAGGDVQIIEQTGDLGLGTIRAEGKVSLIAPGSILDTRTESQTNANIKATGDAELTAQQGQIGTQDQRLVTDVDGVIHTTARGDISIRDLGTLDLVADSESGQVNASAKQDLNLSNTRGDLVVGPMEAGGTVTIVAAGSLVEGDRYGRPAQVIAKSIDLTAKDGDIGTAEDPFDVDTDAGQGGTLAARGDNVYLKEISGDLTLKDIQARQNAAISAPGDILDGNQDLLDGAVEDQKEAANAKAEADKADAEAFVRAEEARKAQKAMEKAQQARDEAQANTEQAIADALKQAKDALAAMGPETDAEELANQQAKVWELEKALEKAQRESKARRKALDEAQAALDKATADYNEAQAAADAAAAKAQQKRQEADDKQAQADKSKTDATGATPTIQTGNDLTLNAGGNIGTADNGLTMAVGGTIDANIGGDNIHISGKGDLNLEEITAPGHVEIATIDGTITGSGIIASGSLDISSLNGDVGRKDNYLHVSTDKLDALGDNVYIHNDKDTQLGQIIAKDQVELEVEGNVTGGDTGKPDIIAGDITINADGNIGTEDQPLDISGNGFHGSGKDIYLDNHTKDLDIRDVNADKLHVTTDGNITGDNNRFHTIFIEADGYVGTPDEPFRFWADGHVKIHGGLGTWYHNLYQEIGLRLRAVVVLRFDVTVDGQACSLYVLVGIGEGGSICVIGTFLCQGEADEAFWTELLRSLRQQGVITLGTVFHDGQTHLAEAMKEVFPGSTDMDLHDREAGETFYQALQRALTDVVDQPMQAVEQIETLAQAVEAAVTGQFPGAQQLLSTVESVLNNG